MEKARLTFHLQPEGHYVALDHFIESLEDLRRMLRGISKSVAKKPVDWLVTDLGIGSAVAAIEPIGDPVDGLTVSRLALKAIEALERDEAPPQTFPQESLEAVKHMAEMLQKAKIRASIFGLNKRLYLTSQTVSTADRLLDNVIWEDYGSVEGSLEMISVHEGHTCNIYEKRTGLRVPGYFRAEHLDQVKAAFGRTVVVHGSIRYNRRGEILSIRADGVSVLPEEHELPTIQDMFGLAPNITNGLSVERYVRRLRDEH